MVTETSLLSYQNSLRKLPTRDTAGPTLASVTWESLSFAFFLFLAFFDFSRTTSSKNNVAIKEATVIEVHRSILRLDLVHFPFNWEVRNHYMQQSWPLKDSQARVSTGSLNIRGKATQPHTFSLSVKERQKLETTATVKLFLPSSLYTCFYVKFSMSRCALCIINNIITFFHPMSVQTCPILRMFIPFLITIVNIVIIIIIILPLLVLPHLSNFLIQATKAIGISSLTGISRKSQHWLIVGRKTRYKL